MDEISTYKQPITPVQSRRFYAITRATSSQPIRVDAHSGDVEHGWRTLLPEHIEGRLRSTKTVYRSYPMYPRRGSEVHNLLKALNSGELPIPPEYKAPPEERRIGQVEF